MDRVLVINQKISNSVDGSGSPLMLKFSKQDVIPIRFIRALRLRVESAKQGNDNLVKSLLILLEFNGSSLGGQAPDEVIAIGRLDIIEQQYIDNFLAYFSDVTEKVAGAESVVSIAIKENDDFK